MPTTVVNLRHSIFDVYIGRAGHGEDGYFGNPFTIGGDGDRNRVIALYTAYFYQRLMSDPEFAERIQLLKGKRLGCFCSPERCHGNVIADYLNIEPKVKPYIDILMANNFCTFASCDGGENHTSKKRFIRIHPTMPTADSLYGHIINKLKGVQEVFDRFKELCDLVEKQKWTYCTPVLVWQYNVISDDLVPCCSDVGDRTHQNVNNPMTVPRPCFELLWN